MMKVLQQHNTTTVSLGLTTARLCAGMDFKYNPLLIINTTVKLIS